MKKVVQFILEMCTIRFCDYKNAKFELRKYNRRKAGLPEETEGCENITSTLYHPDSEKMEIDSESFSSKAKEIQEFFVENGIPMTFK